MYKFAILLLLISSYACSPEPKPQTEEKRTVEILNKKQVVETYTIEDTIEPIITDIDSISTENETQKTEDEAIDDFNFSSMYIVALDTSRNYAQLLRMMNEAKEKFNLKIDSLGRYYNAKKDLICLPDDAEDELYQGEYFPRRYPSEHLSIEYYEFFHPETSNKNMVLLAGIYDDKEDADSLFTLLKSEFPTAFTHISKIYIGCMH